MRNLRIAIAGMRNLRNGDREDRSTWFAAQIARIVMASRSRNHPAFELLWSRGV
jgi:hypothetical protein